MTPNFSQGPLVWMDLEFTDLDVKKGRIVEIATVITDAKLNIKATGPNIVICQSDLVLDGMSDWNKRHFKESGLLDHIKSSNVTLDQASEETLTFIKANCSPQSGILSGSSVYVDREFLGEYMPEIYNYLHYRIIDTNTLKEIMHRWYPSVPDYPKVELHRANKDILESIDELKYYKARIFK
jgi:oligoribonuclease